MAMRSSDFSWIGSRAAAVGAATTAQAAMMKASLFTCSDYRPIPRSP
jgi:hypothetical protein